MTDLAETMAGILAQLTRIANAMEASQPKPKAAKPKADLFDVNAERAIRGKKPARAMPDPFLMTEKHRAFAAERGIVGRAAEHQFDKFKSYHGAKGNTFVSWDQAWQTWVLKHTEFSGTAPTVRPPNDGMDGRI